MIPQALIDEINALKPDQRALLAGLYVYDVESYPNVFTCTVFRPGDLSLWRFEISPRCNQGVEFYTFLIQIKNSGGRMVGFNNLHYDYTVIHSLIERGGHITALELWQAGNAVIRSKDKFGANIPPWKIVIPQIDLFKIHHLDNKARYTSLKTLEFNMMSENIQDLPFKPNTELTNEQIAGLIPYNDHDVFETCKFLLHTLDKIKFRDNLTVKYGRDFTNFNDGKIGSEIFIIGLEGAEVPCYERVNGRRQPRQTIRQSVDLNEATLPWIRFNTIHFERVAAWFRSQVITKTKGVFEFIEVSPTMAMETMSPDVIRVHGLTIDDLPGIKVTKGLPAKLKKGILLKDCKHLLQHRQDINKFRFVSGWKDQSGLNCIVNGFQFDFGTGGIHGSVDSQIVYSDSEYIIVDLDVESYYPNLGIKNRFYPAHLSDVFCDIYDGIFEQRRTFPKGTMENLALKYALNVPYGQSNSAFSPFYDSLYTMKITINGQLLLCLLAEYAFTIQGLRLIQVNTDGITVRLPRRQLQALEFIAETWQQVTGLTLESVYYSRMMIRDVNNYIAEKEDGELKRKGAYCYGKDFLKMGEWHKNFSCQVVAKAAEAALVRGEDIATFVRNTTDPFDFVLSTKVDKKSRLVIGEHDEPLQNITRYYISTVGGVMTKIMPPTDSQLAKDSNAPDRRFSVDAGWLATPCNHMRDFGRNPINYDYYIAEAEKLVNPLLGM